MLEKYTVSNESLLSSATVSQPFDSGESLTDLSTTPRQTAGVGVITQASPGVEIVRDGSRIPVVDKQALIAGDRVLVPKDGFANAVFPGRQPNETPLTGTFTGGTDAVVGVKAAPMGGGEQVQIDLASGDMIVTGEDAASKATTMAVKKAGSAGSEDGGLGWLLPLALGGLAGALLSKEDDNDQTPTVPVEPPVPPVPPVPPTPPQGQGLLDPAANLVDNLTDALDNGPLGALGLGSTLQPVDNLVSAVTNLGNGVLGPLLGVEFQPDSPNALDPVDNLVGQVTDGVGGLLGGLLDPLLGQGAVASLIAPLNNQVDFLTDGVANLLGGGSNGGLLGGLLGLTGGNVPSGGSPLAGDGLLNPAATLVDNLTDSLDAGLLGGLGLGGVLEPVDSLVGTVADLGNNILEPLLGENFEANDPNGLDPVDNLVFGVTDAAGGLLGGLLDPILGQGAVANLIAPLDNQVDFLTDGVANLLGGESGLLGGLLGGDDGLLGGLLGGTSGGLLGELPLVGGLTGGSSPVSGSSILDDVLSAGSSNGSSGGGGLLGGLLGGDSGLLGGLLGGDGGLLGGLLGGQGGGLLGGLLGGGSGITAASFAPDVSANALPISSLSAPDSLLNPVNGVLGSLQ